MVENWADVHGTVQRVNKASEMSGFNRVNLLVDEVKEVENYPELVSVYLAEQQETQLGLLIPLHIVTEYGLKAGMVIECRVRCAGLGRFFVNTDYLLIK
jgi:hypothetical protein